MQVVGTPAGRLCAARIAEACGTIEPTFLGTPQAVEPALSRRFGCELVLKDETANPLGCFKGRGADLFVKRLLAETQAGLRPATTAVRGPRPTWTYAVSPRVASHSS